MCLRRKLDAEKVTMLFDSGDGDRRQRYSFRGHFKRALETKGLRRILLPALSTLAVASVAFAYCSSDKITGPRSSNGQIAAKTFTGVSNGTGGDGGGYSHDPDDDDPHFRPKDPGLLIIPIDIGPPSSIETSFGPIDIPIEMQATACNHDIVQWDPRRSYVTASGFMALNPVTGVVHIRGHFEQRGYGVGTFVPARRYTGYQEYEKEFDLVPPNSRNEEEYELQIIAKGNIEPWPLFPNDDYKLYVKVVTKSYLGVVTFESIKAYTKCW